MRIVVDSNIVFSAILNSSGRIGQLIIGGSKYFQYFTVNLLKEEIFKHRVKILSLSGLKPSQFESTFHSITSRIKFIDEILLSDDIIDQAQKLTADIDENDTLFVALANYLNCQLWTGDKKLISGLRKKNYPGIFTTEELYHIFLQNQIKKR
jgi:predicted nucleic acid-binding protein